MLRGVSPRRSDRLLAAGARAPRGRRDHPERRSPRAAAPHAGAAGAKIFSRRSQHSLREIALCTGLLGIELRLTLTLAGVGQKAASVLLEQLIIEKACGDLRGT